MRFKRRLLRRRLIWLAWPIMLQFYLFQLTGLIDNLMVGQFGEQTIAALGVCLQLNFFVTLCYAALTEGGSVITAQLLGARKQSALRETVSTLLLSSLVVGLLLGALYVLAGKWLLSLLTTDLFRPSGQRSNLPELGYTYLRVLGFGMVFVVLAQVAMHILQALGNTRAPMLLALYGNLLNAAGNYVFLFGGAIPGVLDPWFTPLGIEGVAIATVAAWAFQALIMLRILLRHPSVRMRLTDLGTLVADRLQRVLRLGYPLSVDGFLWQGSSFLYTMMFNRVGAEAYAAVLVTFMIRGFAMAPGVGFQRAVGIALGQAVGADRYARAKAIVRLGMGAVLVTMPLLTLAIWLLTPSFVQLYDIADSTRERIVWMVGIGVLYSGATAITMIVPGILRAGGDTKAPMWITLLGFALVGAPLAYGLGLHWGYGLWGVFAGFVADELAKALMMLVYLRRMTWLNNLAREEKRVDDIAMV